MNRNDFDAVTSTVVGVSPTNAGTEIWVRLQSGRETSYLVSDDSFRAREGHQLTAILHTGHAVALRNDSTMTKIQLLDGRNLLGAGPQVESQTPGFWIGWLLMISCPGMFAVSIIQIIFQHLFAGHAVLNALGGVIAVLIYLGMVFGIPYGCIIHPRLRRAKHNRRVKEADATIAKIFNPL